MSAAQTATTTARPRPGRPSTGARERILGGALAVLKRDGYAGLTTAKVAAASGQNKGLIAYHFGSKQGLVEAVAGRVSATIVADVLDEAGEPATAAELAAGLTRGIWRLMDRDPGLQRVYFDLASQSIVEPSVKAIMADTKATFRRVLVDLLGAIEDGPAAPDREALALFLLAGLEGLSLERLDRGETPALTRARRIFEAAAAEAIRG